MGGLMERWDAGYHDATYQLEGGDAEAVAAHQREVALEKKAPLDPQYWFDHPYPSSFPLCVAVKAAGLQGFELEDRYLRRVREAALVENRDLRTPAALVDLAREVRGLDADRFRGDVDGDAAVKAFREDWRAAREPLPKARDTKTTEGHVRYAFPALVVRRGDGEYRVLDGDHSYADCVEQLQELDPDLAPDGPPDIGDFVQHDVRVTLAEVSLVCDVSWARSEAALSLFVEGGLVRKRLAGDFHMWELVDLGGPIS